MERRDARISALLLMTLLIGCSESTATSAKSDPKQQASAAVDESPSAEATQKAATGKKPTPQPFLDPTKRYLIIHSDDAGLCRSVNRATIEAMERGLVSSASIMVPCRDVEEIAKYAAEHPDRDFGIHLTLNGEFESYPLSPVLPAKEVPGLVNENGHLWASPAQTVANARADEVERELTAQIERAKALGVPVTHLDTHMGALLLRLDFLEVYANLGIKYNVPVLLTRKPATLKKFPTADGFAERAPDFVRALERHGLPLVDDIVMHYVGEPYETKRDFYHKTLRELPPGVHEIIVHCGFAEPDIFAFTSSGGLRDNDRRVFVAPETKAEIERLGIQVISWKQLHQMTAGKKD